MRVHKLKRFTSSIVLKSILLLIVAMVFIVSVSAYLYTKRQTEDSLFWNFNSNQTQLLQLASTTNIEMEQFTKRLSLLTKVTEIQGMDPIVSAGYLKSYNVSTLFSSGETVSLYDRSGTLICDNAMVGSSNTTYPIDKAKISPVRASQTPWYRDVDNTPKKAFGIAVIDRAHGDGALIASFALRSRLWKYFSDYKVGNKGYIVAISGSGEILYHPDLKAWLENTHKISELGLDFDPKSFETKDPQFQKLNDGTTYLINYNYNSIYDLGLIALQPKSELDAMAAYVRNVSAIMLSFAIFAILLVAFWMIMMLARPLSRLIEHITQITNGNMDIEEIHVGKRHDEIGQLSKAFNQMHSTIQRQIRELNNHRKMLEQEVYERTQELEEANKKLDLISRTDELTQLPNRRDMNETIENEVGRSARTHKPFCFIFIDIDHFKNVNDTYGHQAGDMILKSVSCTVRNLLRKYDVLSRYGGEEFLTLLPETDLEGAAVVAERFRKQIENTTIRYAEFDIKVTITLGVSLYDPKLGADRSIQLADKALYEGKESGRNKVVVWDPKRTTADEYKQAAMEDAECRR